MNTINYLDYELLKIIKKNPNSSQREIAKALQCSLGKTNEIINGLKKLKYIDDNNTLTKNALSLFKDEKNAIILAAGQGIRMIPINNTIPKAMLEINNEIIIERLIKQLNDAGIFDITIVVGFMKEEFDYLIDMYNVKLVVNTEYYTKNNLHSLDLVRNKIKNTYIIPCDLYFKKNPFIFNEIQSWYMFKNTITIDSDFKYNNKHHIHRVKQNGHKMVGLSFINEDDSKILKENLIQLDNDAEYMNSFWEEALFNQSSIQIFSKVVDDNLVNEINTYEDLREIDSDSSHLKNDTMKLIAKELHVELNNISNITSLKKGMTNRSFLFNVDDNKYIMRIPGEGTDLLINRQEEYDVYQAIKDLQISDEVIYMNPINGYKITKFLNDTRLCDQNNDDDLRRCMSLLKEFHKSNLKVNHTFDVFEKIDFYEKLRGEKSLYKDYKETKKNVLHLKKIIDQMPKIWTLCHIDANCDNFLFYKENGKEKIKLIDWEYAAMQDAHIDIAMFCIYSMYDRKQVDNLIDIYFEGQCEKNIRLKIYCYIAMCGLLWSNWCEYKYTLGVEFGEYSLAQYRYAKDYYKIVKNEVENL